MKSYKLVNPKTEGTINNEYRGKSPLEAAENMWGKFSEHMTTTVPNFMFSLQDMANGKNEHFKVSEDSESGEYHITHIKEHNYDDKKLDKFDNHVNEYTKSMNGGKSVSSRHRYRKYEDDFSSDSSSDSDSNSSSSSDSDSDIERNFFPKIKSDVPISMMYYNPQVYYSVDPKYNSLVIDIVPKPIFLPTFKPEYKTYISLWPSN
jgi:hypothetical protein|uniref:Uncharacterized protein n=1 Tax=viral metagenome TaxID=1070528 RepID=A0A6C0BFJ2_9ZZZZ